MKLPDIRDDKLVAAYISLRDKRATRKAEFDAADADDKSKQEKIEAEFLRRFNDRGINSVSAEGTGTAYKSIRTSATVADRGVYIDWVLEEPVNRVAFLDVRANKTTVEQYRAANDDLPPGLNWSETATVNFRRS